MTNAAFFKHFLLFPALLFSLSASAQFGISTFHNWNDGRVSVDNGPREELSIVPVNNRELALHYWFRLPKQRVEFQPTIYYGTTGSGDSELAQYGFQFKTNFYVFDFATDCDCPTFGKQGPQLEKGFFLQLAPGVAYHDLSIGSGSNATTFSLAGGLGLDFGVSNLLTLTPLLSIRHHFGDILDDGVFADENNQPVEVDTRLTTLQVGLQATFRFDKKRY